MVGGTGEEEGGGARAFEGGVAMARMAMADDATSRDLEIWRGMGARRMMPGRGDREANCCNTVRA